MAATPDPTVAQAAAAERRLAARLAEVEVAASEGRLIEVIKEVPSIEEQLRPHLSRPTT